MFKYVKCMYIYTCAMAFTRSQFKMIRCEKTSEKTIANETDASEMQIFLMKNVNV